jgi:hypothetical protein
LEQGHQATRVAPTGVGEEGEGDVELVQGGDDRLELRVEGGLTSGELEAVNVRAQLGQDFSPPRRREGLWCAIVIEDVSTARAAAVAYRGQFERIEDRNREDKRRFAPTGETGAIAVRTVLLNVAPMSEPVPGRSRRRRDQHYFKNKRWPIGAPLKA